MTWFYSGSPYKSAGELQRLVKDVLTAPDFDAADLEGFRASKELQRLDNFTDTSGAFSASDGWRQESFRIKVPKEKTSWPSEADAPEFEVEGFFSRDLLETVTAACRNLTSCKFNWIPFQLFWDPESKDGSQPKRERVYSEVSNANAMLAADADIRAQPRHPDDDPNVEYAVAGIMVWSDSTHLASFGMASLWPIYGYLANLSKYLRAKPRVFAAHHIAYIPKVSHRQFVNYTYNKNFFVL
ncbi:hypothetical protein A0H81_08956 [Grifola frondosa]|uniref:Uncharacterized protein n=1 Tax=Grifola frondosa TaxID=5627 RepID=A0A1C7M574_GRIFR|nr:hypothetical protein A0H81_08956 [Grifola frondosa]